MNASVNDDSSDSFPKNLISNNYHRGTHATSVEKKEDTFEDRVLEELKSSLNQEEHPIKQLIQSFRDILVAQINHFNEFVIDYKSKLLIQDANLANTLKKYPAVI